MMPTTPMMLVMATMSSSAPLYIARNVLEQARTFVEERGADGLEGTAMIARRGTDVAERLVIPTQHAARGICCWVEVPWEGKLELAAALGPEEQYVARIHSHPGEAFHSDVDSRNPALTHH